ncbi:unnamed protein product [Pipistrellus nathusii]|uniref:Uncharacterized protein n=1 Tax=Pipistrellus nathusii TaxID=59473 RepID=A0ABN9ZFR4_PIPNA
MALKAEGTALDCFKVMLKYKQAEGEEAGGLDPEARADAASGSAGEDSPPRPCLLEAGGSGCEEPRLQMTWEQGSWWGAARKAAGGRWAWCVGPRSPSPRRTGRARARAHPGAAPSHPGPEPLGEEQHPGGLEPGGGPFARRQR